MQLGLQIPRFTWRNVALRARLAEIGGSAEDAGFTSLWVMDHFFQIPSVGEVDEPILEAYTTLGFLAAATARVRLGAMVTGVTYRWPGVLVKQVTTLDVLSGGRAILGIGAGWYEREHVGLGVPFPPLKERFERLEETLQIAHQMWRGDTRPFKGRHYQLQEPLNSPLALTQPHPPILVGGGGEQKTLRLVARYADACNLSGRLPKEDLRRKLDVLRGYCQQEGRDYDEIEKTAMVLLAPASDGQNMAGFVDELGQLADLGFDTVIASLLDIETPLQTIETVGRDVMPQLHALGRADSSPRKSAA
jgi:F420-dependent oxidoreductase-like protein